jgi:hypothetical protein
MKFLILLLISLGIAGCDSNDDPPKVGEKRDPDTGRVYSSRALVSLDNGCTIHEVKVRNHGTFYITYCPTGIAVNYSCGKRRCDNSVVQSELSEEEVAKAAALSKLTADERKILGLKETK